MHSVWDLAKTIFIEHDFQYIYIYVYVFVYAMLHIDLGQNETVKKTTRKQIFTNEIVGQFSSS